MNMCPTNKCKSTPESCLKGQVFFILTNCSNQEILKTRISLLGGKVEEFLSKDVTTLLVEDNQLIGQELLPDHLSVKTTYNTVNGTIVASFPYPGTLTNIPSTSRGYNFLATTNTSTKYSPYRLIGYARQYGIQVLGIAQFLTWTEPQIKVIRQKQPRKTSENVSNLSGYFIKFESVNKNYRPCYKMFNNDPDRLVPLKNASVLVKPETCNVILNKPVVTKHLQLNHMDPIVRPAHQVKGPNFPVKVNDKKPQNNRPKPKEDNNYCECCKTHFADFKQHIKSSKHQSFVSNDKNYESVHNILKMLPTAQEFIESLQKPSPDSDPVLTNGDNSATMPVANIPEIDYSVPLNLEVRRENLAGTTVQVSTHIVKNNNELQMRKEEVMPLPLDLHIKRNDEIKVQIKQEPNLHDNCEQIGLHKKEEVNLLQVKQEPPENEVLVGNIKVVEKQPNAPLDIQCDEPNGGDFLDKTNTAALAQLCLKNFDSYWLDSLPSEVEDMEFDDIFAFDENKIKVDDEGFEPFVDNIVNSEVPQTPGLVSGISNSNLKTDNTSIFMNTSVDVKDFIKTEPSNQDNFPSTCKLGKENETSVSPLNVAVPFNDTLSLENKKSIFSIASFCSEKINIEATPSCSNTIPSKNLEPLFSSESSDDDENGNVLISNALNFITNSDNEGKLDKESGEENSLEEKFKINALLKKDSTVSGLRCNQPEAELSTVKNIFDTNRVETQFLSKENCTTVLNPLITETNTPVESSQSNSFMNNANIDKRKVSFQSNENLSKTSSFISDDSKHQTESVTEKSKKHNNDKDSKSINASCENPSNAQAKIKSSSATNTDTQKSASISTLHTKELPSSGGKNDPEKCKENNSLDKEKEWDYTCNKIYKKYPIPLNRSADSTKTQKEKTPIKNTESSPSKHLEVNKKTSEKYPNPKKNISMREMAVKQNNSTVSTFSASEEVNQPSYQATVTAKNVCSAETSSYKTEKKNEANTDKKEKVNTSSVKSVPAVRKVDQISFKPYISDDRKVSFGMRQNLERNAVVSSSYTADVLSKSSVSEHRMGYDSYMDVNPVTNICPSETTVPHKQEYIYSNKINLSTANTDIHNWSNSSKSMSSENPLSLKKNENRSSSISPTIKNYSLDREVITKPTSISCSNVSSAFENKATDMSYKFMTQQKEGKVDRNINQTNERSMNLSTIDLSCFPMTSVHDKSRANKPYCDTATSAKSGHLPEGKTSIEKKSHSEIKSAHNFSNSKTASNQNLDENSKTDKGSSHKKVAHVTNSMSTPSDKNFTTLNSSQCQNDVKLNKNDITSVKTLNIPEEKIKEKDSSLKNNTPNIPNTSRVSDSQFQHRNANNDASESVKNLTTHKEDNSKTELGLNLSNSKCADPISYKKVSGDFTSIKSLISQDKSPTLEKKDPEQKTSSDSVKTSSDSRTQISSDLSQYPSAVEESVKHSSETVKHFDNSELNVRPEIPTTAIILEKQASLVNIQNQISCDAPSTSKNLQLQEHHKKQTSIQTSIKLNVCDANISCKAPRKGNSINQADTVSKNTGLKQDRIYKKRKKHSELTSSSNMNFNSASVPHHEKKDHCTNYEYFIPFKRKKVHRKEKKVRKKMKRSPVSVNKLTVSKINTKGQTSKGLSNQCQYSYRTAKYNMDTSSGVLSVKSSVEKQTLKIPHQKQSSRLRELPPLWTVSVNGVKLKFTRVYPKKIDTYQYVTEDDSD